MTTPRDTQWKQTIAAEMAEILRKALEAFTTSREDMASTARQRIDGDATQSKRIGVDGKSRTETP